MKFPSNIVTWRQKEEGAQACENVTDCIGIIGVYKSYKYAGILHICVYVWIYLYTYNI